MALPVGNEPMDKPPREAASASARTSAISVKMIDLRGMNYILHDVTLNHLRGPLNISNKVFSVFSCKENKNDALQGAVEPY